MAGLQTTITTTSMESLLNLLWLIPPAAGLAPVGYVRTDARRSAASVRAMPFTNARILYVAESSVRREWRRVVMQLLLLASVTVVAFGRHRIETDTRILMRNLAIVIVSPFVVRQSVADVVDRRYLTRSLRSEALAEFAKLCGTAENNRGRDD
jgi:hypothetical protein